MIRWFDHLRRCNKRYGRIIGTSIHIEDTHPTLVTSIEQGHVHVLSTNRYGVEVQVNIVEAHGQICVHYRVPRRCEGKGTIRAEEVLCQRHTERHYTLRAIQLTTVGVLLGMLISTLKRPSVSLMVHTLVFHVGFSKINTGITPSNHLKLSAMLRCCAEYSKGSRPREPLTKGTCGGWSANHIRVPSALYFLMIFSMLAAAVGLISNATSNQAD